MLNWQDIQTRALADPSEAHEAIVQLFYELWKAGSPETWRAYLVGLRGVLKNVQPVSSQPDHVHQWRLLETLASDRLAETPGDARALIDGSKHGNRIVQLLAKRAADPKGDNELSLQQLQDLLKLKRTTLSMAIRPLIDNKVVRTRQDGRNSFLQLGPEGRAHAVRKGWLDQGAFVRPTHSIPTLPRRPRRPSPRTDSPEPPRDDPLRHLPLLSRGGW